MRLLLAVSLLALLAACGEGDKDRFEFVKAKNLDQVREPRNCGKSVIPNYGCWKRLDPAGGCKIIVEWPRHTGDTARLTTLGKEVWKCLEGNTEY